MAADRLACCVVGTSPAEGGIALVMSGCTGSAGVVRVTEARAVLGGVTESDSGGSADVKSGVPMESSLCGEAEMRLAKGCGGVAAACEGRALGCRTDVHDKAGCGGDEVSAADARDAGGGKGYLSKDEQTRDRRRLWGRLPQV